MPHCLSNIFLKFFLLILCLYLRSILYRTLHMVKTKAVVTSSWRVQGKPNTMEPVVEAVVWVSVKSLGFCFSSVAFSIALELAGRYSRLSKEPTWKKSRSFSNTNKILLKKQFVRETRQKMRTKRSLYREKNCLDVF